MLPPETETEEGLKKIEGVNMCDSDMNKVGQNISTTCRSLFGHASVCPRNQTAQLLWLCSSLEQEQILPSGISIYTKQRDQERLKTQLSLRFQTNS